MKVGGTNRLPTSSQTRKRRQVLVPYIGNTGTMDSLLVPGLSDQQQELGEMITGQTGQSLLPGDGSDFRRQNIVAPFIGQQGMLEYCLDWMLQKSRFLIKDFHFFFRATRSIFIHSEYTAYTAIIFTDSF